MKKILIFFFLIAAALQQLIVMQGCANIIPPTGGPRDSLAPVLISATPKDSMLNFTGKKIVLVFDEYVELDQKLQENLVVSPNPEATPMIDSKLKTVTINLKDSLLPNTTYSINFGSSIKDVNEGNFYKNFTYVFSTGNELSNGTFSGRVLIAETGLPDSTLIVVLQRSASDTAVVKNKPAYYTKLDGSGRFQFKYLPNETFHVFVVPDDFSKKYDDSTKMFAFYDEAVTAGQTTDSIRLFAYQQYKPADKNQTRTAAPAEKKDEDKRLRLTVGISGEQDLLKDLDFSLNRKVKLFDSTKIILADTNYKTLPGVSFTKDTTEKKFTLKYNWRPDENYKLIIYKEAFTDSAGTTLSKSDTLTFKTKSESDYGSLRLHFNNLDLSLNPVLQILKQNELTQSVILNSPDWYSKLTEPGEYELRILFDKNKNGIWDPGDYSKKLQPEMVQRIGRKLNVRGNIDNEVDINL